MNHYPDGHNLGPGMVYDTPEEKEIMRLEAKVKRLQAELIASQAEAKTLQGFADLWYFAMDHAPGEFERIVTTCQPALWMHEIAKVRRGER
jgi:hypothetical protein